jgi:hypothetical protein
MTPVQVEAYARRTHRFHLSDFKIPFGVVGFEKGYCIEAYRPQVGWVQIRWDTPYPIQRAGEMVLIRVQGVTELADWDIHAPFIF